MSAASNPEEGLNANERIAIVDEVTNEVVGSARRAEMRRDNLPHRATYIFIQCPRGDNDNYNNNNSNSSSGGNGPLNPDLWVQKRTMIKDYCPGYLAPSTGGVVGHGETYEENVQRELEEEMGITARSETVTLASGGEERGEREEGVLRHCFSFHYKDDHTNVWGDVWDCVWGGTIVPQPEEVDSVHRYSLSELIDGRDSAGNTLKCTPDGVFALGKYRGWLATNGG